MPLDVDFAVTDMLEVVSPKFKRTSSVEEADDYVATLESQHKLNRVRGLQTLVVVTGDGAGEEDSEEEEEDTRGQRAGGGGGSEDEGAGANNGGGDEEEMDVEEERDRFDYQDEGGEEEEEVIVHWKPQAAQPSPEDEAFDAEFQKMLLGDRAVTVTQARQRQLDLSIPLDLQAQDDNSMPELVERGGETKVMFKLLTKDKKDRAAAKAFEVPIDTTIAHASFERSNAEATEKDEVKRKVLGYQAAVDGGIVLNQYHQAYRGGFRGRSGYSSGGYQRR